jgi:DNA-binding transcriptional LysR family regulator
MVELDQLTALDGLQWLGAGEEVARRYDISQATVSRSCRKVLKTFGLQLERQNGELDLIGDQTLLQLERDVHQQARLAWRRPLRLEATYWSAPTLCNTLPPGWLLGRSNIVGVRRNFQLLQDGVVDAWLAGLPDLPTADQPDLTAVPLSRMPVFFTCAAGHPLLERQSLTYDDIAQFPTLALPTGTYPLVEQALQAIGLWNDGVRMTRYRRELWEGKAEVELVVGYGTPLSMQISGGALCRLPLQLPFASGDALVFRRALGASPRLQQLLDHLRARVARLARMNGEIVPVSLAESRPASGDHAKSE